MSDLKNMLTRMYNLSLHTNGCVDLMHVPYSWMMYWSRTLEADLSEARLKQMVSSGRARRRGR